MNACVWSLAVALTFLAACIVDTNDPCGDHQVKTTGEFLGCVCQPGYAFSADGKRCVKAAEDAGAKDSGDEDAAEPTDPNPPSGPTGEMSPCTSSDDCAGFYATFCQTLQAPSICLIQGCATGERRCVGSSICCSFPSFPPLAVTNGICVPADSCISPGMPVTP